MVYIDEKKSLTPETLSFLACRRMRLFYQWCAERKNIKELTFESNRIFPSLGCQVWRMPEQVAYNIQWIQYASTNLTKMNKRSQLFRGYWYYIWDIQCKVKFCIYERLIAWLPKLLCIYVSVAWRNWHQYYFGVLLYSKLILGVSLAFFLHHLAIT